MAERYRVQKLLSSYGYCSRRKAEELIKEGKVRVNDQVITIGDQATEDDKIYVDDVLVEKQKKVYAMFNKPMGCVTALSDPVFETVIDHIDIKERVFPIGRLDYNTSGLLLLTNDGDFANNVMHPRYEIKKTYKVGVFEAVKDKDMDKIRQGIILDDGKTSPAEVKKVETKVIEITIHEGKNRIIRRMMDKLGYKVRFLERVRIGKLDLDDLKQGRFRHLNEKDIKKVFE